MQPQTAEITIAPVIASSKPAASQVDVAELQTQLIKLQNQVTQLQAAQKTQAVAPPTPAPTPVSKPEPKFFKRSGTLIAPNSDIVLLPLNDSKK
jgi:hypothetical protein